MPLWLLGYPEAALADAADALKEARDIGQAATLMIVLCVTRRPVFRSGNYPAATLQIDELIALADKKRAVFWKAHGMCIKGVLSGLTGNASNAVHMIIPASPPSAQQARSRRAAVSIVFGQGLCGSRTIR